MWAVEDRCKDLRLPRIRPLFCRAIVVLIRTFSNRAWQSVVGMPYACYPRRAGAPQLGSLAVEKEWALGALDHLRMGAILTDGLGVPLFVNSAQSSQRETWFNHVIEFHRKGALPSCRFGTPIPQSYPLCFVEMKEMMSWLSS